MKLLGNVSVGVDVTHQLLIISFVFVRYWRKNVSTMRQTVYQLFVDFKKAYDTVRNKVLYNILIEFGVPMKLFRLNKVCLNEMYGKVCVGKNLSDNFPIQDGLKQGDDCHCFKCSLEYASRKVH
jgi:sorting nexin-29